MSICRAAIVLVLLAVSVMTPAAQTPAPVQSSAPGTTAARYLTPPQVIVDILDAAPIPTGMLSPTRDTFALSQRRSMPPIAELAQPMLRLAGERINPRTNGPHRTSGITGITFMDVATGVEHKATIPADGTLITIGYAPNGRRYAFGRIAQNGIELWTADPATGQAARLGDLKLNATGGVRFRGSDGPCTWLQDSSALACMTVPASRGPVPAAPTVPEGPNIQESSGKAAPVRTYEDLLTSAYDEQLFEYYFTSQLALIDAASGKQTMVGKPALFEEARPSPSGAYFLVVRTKRPFSRLVPRE